MVFSLLNASYSLLNAVTAALPLLTGDLKPLLTGDLKPRSDLVNTASICSHTRVHKTFDKCKTDATQPCKLAIVFTSREVCIRRQISMILPSSSQVLPLSLKVVSSLHTDTDGSKGAPINPDEPAVVLSDDDTPWKPCRSGWWWSVG